MTQDFLAGMAAASRARVDDVRRDLPLAQLEARAHAAAPAAPLRLSGGGFDVIAEVKLRSPAVGALASRGGSADVDSRVAGYAAAGAAAVSVLTEPSRFDGALDHLETAAHALAGTGVPAMRKDFLVDPYQVLEARAAGAGGVLVILRMLTPAEIRALVEASAELSMFVLLEAFDERDIVLGADIAASAPAGARLLLGVNSRDLVTLEVVPGRLEALASCLPADLPRVAESGVSTADDAARLASAGYDLALVGSALMTAPDPRALLDDMLHAGRRARHTGDGR